MIEIRAKLKRLSGLMCDMGYVPYTKLVLHDMEEEEEEEEEEKVFHLCHHSEKLATAFGLINRALSTPLQIIKNLQVCDSSTKVHFKNSWESNHGEGCKSLSSL
jgi:hypothetical protein